MSVGVVLAPPTYPSQGNMSPSRSPDELAHAIRRQAAVAEVGQVGLRSRDVEELLGAAMRIATETLDADHAALFELFAAQGRLQGRAAHFEGQAVQREAVNLLQVPTGRGSMPGFALLEGGAVTSVDLLNDHRFVALAPVLGFASRAAISVPIGWENHDWGVLSVYDLDVRVWSEDEVHFVQSVANMLGLAIQRQAVEQELRAARREAERAGARMATLSEASALFSQSLDPDLIIASLTEFYVPHLADVIMVEALDANGRVAPCKVRGGHPDQEDAFIELLELTPGLSSLRTWCSSTTILYDEATGIDEVWVGASSDQRQALDRLAPTRLMACPLVARGQVLGMLTLVETDPTRHRSSVHDDMVEDLASRGALALDNGRLFESRNRMLKSLQSVLVPPTLPQPDGMVFAARFRVAHPNTDIGGDFYDVMTLEGGRVGVVVGDVCGSGPDAAALTGLLRHSIRAAAVRDPSPTEVLAQTNDAVVNQLDDFRFCTATYLLADPAQPDGSVHMSVSSAGHPRPVIVRSTGEVEVLECSGVLLGVVGEPHLVELHVHLEAGDSVVLYTDGVTEARGDIGLFGEDRLVEVLASTSGASAEQIASALDEAVRRHRSGGDDDIAILVLQSAPTHDR